MQSKFTPDDSLSRIQRRRIAGVRAAWIWGGVLVALTLIYWAVYGVMAHFSDQRWAKAINKALQARDAENVSALLIACRREAPRLIKTPAFALWQQELLKLQQQNARRKVIFAQKLKSLQQRAAAPGGESAPLELELANAARYAADEEDLASLRTLQLHCETLARSRMLSFAQAATQELGKLQQAKSQLAPLRQQHKWSEHNELLARLQKSVQTLSGRYQTLPEAAAAAENILLKLQNEARAAKAQQQAIRQETAAYHAVLKAVSKADIAAQAAEFMQKYPASCRQAVLQQLLKDLAVLDRPGDVNLRKRLNLMEENLGAAKKLFVKELNSISQSELETGSFELILKSGFNEYFHFETLDDAKFSEFDARKICRIKFTLLDGRKLYGEFTASGVGKVDVAGRLFAGTMVNGSPRGKLPVSYKQSLLLKLESMCQSGKEEHFPEFLYILQQELDLNKLIPETLHRKLTAALRLAESVLRSPAGEFIFERSILSRCLELTPRFAGLAMVDEQGKLNYFSDGRDHRRTTVWAVEANSNALPAYTILGTLEKRSLKVSNASLVPPERVRVLAVPQTACDIAGELAAWRKLAAKDKNFSKLPVLPEFLSWK